MSFIPFNKKVIDEIGHFDDVLFMDSGDISKGVMYSLLGLNF